MRGARILLPLALLALPGFANADGAALLHKPITAGHCGSLGSPNLIVDSGVGCSGSAITIDDGAHGKMTFVPSVFGSASSAGILNTTPGQPVILTRGVSSTGTDAYDFYATRIANYAGGTPGFVNSSWRFLDTVSAGTKSFEWTATEIMDNSASAADATENVANYAQAHKRNDGGTWASVSELLDHGANPTSPSVTHEYDLEMIGADTNGSRVILDGWAKSLDGNPAVTRHGIRLNTDTHTTFTNGVELNGAYTHGINLTGGTYSAGALELGSGQKLCFDGTGCTQYLSQSAGTLTYTTPTGAVLSETSGGTLTNFGNIVAGGSIQGAGVASTASVQLPTGSKICFDGSTCSSYMIFTGSAFQLFIGGTIVFAADNTGTVASASKFAVGTTPGLNCVAGGSRQTSGGIVVIC